MVLIYMEMKKVEIEVPAGIEQYTVLEDKDEQLKRNAMLVYPYIQNGTISYGKAAELLGIYKMDLITLYGSMGIAYFDESREKLEADLMALESLGHKENVKENALGPVGMARFIQQFDSGHGDYTKEKQNAPDIDLDEIDALLKA